MKTGNRKKKIKYIRKIFLYPLVVVLVYAFLLIFPQVIFPYKVIIDQFTVYADTPLDNNIYKIIPEAGQRIKKSELYRDDISFRLFLCNQSWRYWLLTQGKVNTAAIAETNITRNIYFNKCDVANNEMVPRKGAVFDHKDRPLTYYFAHEMTHILESNYAGRYNRAPSWLREGYADYIGKGGNFDFEGNLELLKENDPALNPKNGLYNQYHLMVAYLLDNQKMSIREVYLHPPEKTKIWGTLLALPR